MLRLRGGGAAHAPSMYLSGGGHTTEVVRKVLVLYRSALTGATANVASIV